MSIRTVGVVGAGTMGNGIAQAFATAGIPVVMTDIASPALAQGMKTIDASLSRLVQRQKITEADKAAALSRISTSTLTPALADCDLVIEAATENPDVKLKIFAHLEAVVKPDAIIATNTSSISITKLASATKRPDKVMGMHFFNPVPVMALVELIRGIATSDETAATIEAITRKIGKTPINAKNSPAFAVNRVLCTMLNEAIFTLGEGVASAQEIDDGMRLGCNHPIGPLALCDLVGLDVLLDILKVLNEQFKDPKYRPAPLLVEMVDAGYLGRKTGRGFFVYK